jgi:ATP-dependent exoDNAse (exonuclease V) alpha subunit
MEPCLCHFAVNVIQRSAGRSVTAAVAYRTYTTIRDERTGQTFDYSRKRGLEFAGNILPVGIDIDRYKTTAELWNAVEVSETRKNSIVGREYVIAIPAELDEEGRKHLVVEFAAHIANKYKIVANVAIHEPGENNDARNYHAHIMTSTREITLEGFGEKTRILDCKNTSQAEITDLRNTWAEMANRFLEIARSDRRMDPRSFAERGIEKIPEVHLGPAASAMERRGERTAKGDLNREIREVNIGLAAARQDLAEEAARALKQRRKR